jgi:hypothetical protein
MLVLVVVGMRSRLVGVGPLDRGRRVWVGQVVGKQIVAGGGGVADVARRQRVVAVINSLSGSTAT